MADRQAGKGGARQLGAASQQQAAGKKHGQALPRLASGGCQRGLFATREDCTAAASVDLDRLKSVTWQEGEGSEQAGRRERSAHRAQQQQQQQQQQMSTVSRTADEQDSMTDAWL